MDCLPGQKSGPCGEVDVSGDSTVCMFFCTLPLLHKL